MSTPLILHTHLKNTDLHALSAFEAITLYLGYTPLKRLRRFTRWELEFSNPKTQTTDLIRILEGSYVLLNVNKEAYFHGEIPQISLEKNNHLFLVTVAPKTSDNSDTMLQEIFQKTEVALKSLKKFLIWEIWVQSSASRSELEKELLEKVIVTSAQHKGLLVNPLYETTQFLA